MNWGLIGCGVIGERRAQNLPADVRLTHVFDPNPERAQKLAALAQSQICKNLDEILNSGIQAVIIAGINSILADTLQKCLDKGLHVLIEKPAARSYSELASVKNPHKKVIKIGFNHRFHPAYMDLLKELRKNPEDKVMFIRAQYGNGARLGFEKEWRAQVTTAGGGELLDQGVHVLDLASQIFPQMNVQAGYVKTHYWQMPVDDNAWAILADKSGGTFSMHVSSSEWKNEFRFEVYTQKRKYQWLGLGRSYGPEKLLIYKMKPEMGPPDFEERTYPAEDQSWLLENENFLKSIQGQDKVFGGYEDALHTLKLVEDIYQSSLKIQGPKLHPQWWGAPL